jgi:glycosyltransferase involved in cell wall biosynthesis
MAVSIIVPAYNSEKFLANALESILAQTRNDWEVIVVNDGSTDQTGTIAASIAAMDKRIRVVHQDNAGVSAARNRGFAESRQDYEYVLFFDSDDVLEPDGLAMLLRPLEKDRDAVAAHGLVRFIDSQGRPIAFAGHYTHPGRRRAIQGKRLKVLPVASPTTFAALAYGCSVTTPVMVRRAQMAIARGFDPSLNGYEDWDLWLRLSRLGHIAFANRIVSAYRHHESNATRNQSLMRESKLYVRKKMFTSIELNKQEIKLILIGYRYDELRRAHQRFVYVGRNIRKGKMIDAFKQLQLAMGHILSSMKGLTRA